MRFVLTIALVATLATSSGAYDLLYTGDTAVTPTAGSFGLSGGFLYFMADSEFDSEGESVDWPEDFTMTRVWVPIDIYYGVMDNLQVGATPVFMMDTFEYPVFRNTSEATGTGVGDTWLWTKFMFMPEPMMTARLGVKLPTGEDEPDEEELATGSGQMDIDAAVLFGAPAGPGTFDAAIGYRYRMDREVGEMRYDYTPGNELHFFACYTHYFNDMFDMRVGADGFFGSDPEADGEPIPDPSNPSVSMTGRNAVYINPGIDYMMDSGLSIGVDMHYPLMGQNIDADWGFGLTLAWGT